MPLIRHHTNNGPIRLDWAGALLLAASLGCLQLFVEMLPKHGLTVSMALLALCSMAAFTGLYFCEKHAANPILPFEMFRNPALASLFTLSVLMGFMMFALLFYMPLLLQGGFGLSPNAAGMLITPLVVCITIGSIFNGRLLTRIANPARVLYAGLAFLGLSAIGITTLKQTTPHALLIIYMIGSGLGLGFVLPNLTIFTQQIAGRAHLGIATAMIQSLRMVGGMLGTALVGTLVNHLYLGRIHTALEAAQASQWFPRLHDPQILINKEAQSEFVVQLHGAGQNGAALLEMARVSLVSSIHIGQMLSVAVVAAAVLQMRRVPRLRLTR
jgi:predicted MFS family arabinose efflux permease